MVRLKTLFKRAREQAPNILFIRDLDFMTRHRERYPMFGSVRATTQLYLQWMGIVEEQKPLLPTRYFCNGKYDNNFDDG